MQTGKGFLNLSSFGKRLNFFPSLFFSVCALALGKVHAEMVAWGRGDGD